MEKPSVDEPLLVTAGAEKGNENAAAAEAKRLLRLAGPLVLSSILQFALPLVSVMFVGHLGELPLAGASLATSIANVTGFSLLVSIHYTFTVYK
jgi:MATE family multidrug resistance protein